MKFHRSDKFQPSKKYISIKYIPHELNQSQTKFKSQLNDELSLKYIHQSTPYINSIIEIAIDDINNKRALEGFSIRKINHLNDMIFTKLLPDQINNKLIQQDHQSTRKNRQGRVPIITTPHFHQTFHQTTHYPSHKSNNSLKKIQLNHTFRSQHRNFQKIKSISSISARKQPHAQNNLNTTQKLIQFFRNQKMSNAKTLKNNHSKLKRKPLNQSPIFTKNNTKEILNENHHHPDVTYQSNKSKHKKKQYTPLQAKIEPIIYQTDYQQTITKYQHKKQQTLIIQTQQHQKFSQLKMEVCYKYQNPKKLLTQFKNYNQICAINHNVLTQNTEAQQINKQNLKQKSLQKGYQFDQGIYFNNIPKKIIGDDQPHRKGFSFKLYKTNKQI